MNEEHPEDLLAAYALDALQEGEWEAVRAHVAACLHCRRLLQAFQQVANVLPLAMANPEELAPPELRERIVLAARQSAQLPPLQPARRPRQSFTGRLGGWVVAAAVFLAALALGGWDLAQHRMLEAAQHQPAVQQVALAATAAAPGAAGNITILPGRVAVLSVDHLPPRTGLLYEAWIITGSTPRPAGTFATTPDGHGSVSLGQPVRPGDTVAITAEPPPGAPAPTGKILLSGKPPV